MVAAAIMIYLVQKFQSINFTKIFTRDTIPVMGYVFLLTGINFLLQFQKWKSVFKEMLGALTNKKIASSFFVGVATGSFTPGRFGEYFGRSLMIKEYPAGDVVSASIVDKLANMFILVFSGLFSTIWFLSFTKTFSSGTIYLLAAFLIFLLCILLYSIFKTKAPAHFYKWIEKLRLLKRMFFHLQVLKRTNSRTVFVQLLYSFLLYGIIALQYGLLTSAFAGKPLESTFFFCGILTLFVKSFIPSISFGDLGIRESASIFFISAIGLPAEVGFLSAFSIFLFNILLPSVIGLILLLTTKR